MHLDSLIMPETGGCRNQNLNWPTTHL